MSEVNFKPINQNVLVVAPIIDEKTKSGLYKSDLMVKEEKKKLDQFLEVAAVSDEVTQVEVGNKVLLGNGSFTTIEIDDVAYLQVHVLTILGKRLW